MWKTDTQVIIIHFKAYNRNLYKSSVAILFGGWERFVL